VGRVGGAHVRSPYYLISRDIDTDFVGRLLKVVEGGKGITI
jgi:hypothetical protein